MDKDRKSVRAGDEALDAQQTLAAKMAHQIVRVWRGRVAHGPECSRASIMIGCQAGPVIASELMNSGKRTLGQNAMQNGHEQDRDAPGNDDRHARMATGGPYAGLAPAHARVCRGAAFPWDAVRQ